MSDKSQLESELENAVESDDNAAAKLALGQIEDLESDSPARQGLTLTKQELGIGAFTPVLASLSVEEINALQVVVEDADDLAAMLIPGTSVLDADHRIHLTSRGDVKRAARGLAIAAAGGVHLESQVIQSNSGSSYTIDGGICFELQQTEQPDFSGTVTILEKRVPCKGHLAYNKVDGGWKETGESHLRCLHQWALMFALGYFVTASKGTFFEKLIVTTEIASRVGDENARTQATAQIENWVSASDQRRAIRTGFAQAITAEKNELGLADNSYLPSKTEIGGYTLPTGETVAEGVNNLKGRQFILKVRVPMNGVELDLTTRVVKNITELASAVAPHFAVARANDGKLLALELIAR